MAGIYITPLQGRFLHYIDFHDFTPATQRTINDSTRQKKSFRAQLRSLG
jgi:uncharacterized protein with GYD domain